MGGLWVIQKDKPGRIWWEHKQLVRYGFSSLFLLIMVWVILHMVVGATLCIVGCLTVSLVSAHIYQQLLAFLPPHFYSLVVIVKNTSRHCWAKFSLLK